MRKAKIMCFQVGRSSEERISGVLMITDQKTDVLIPFEKCSFKISYMAQTVRVLPHKPEDLSLTLETHIMV